MLWKEKETIVILKREGVLLGSLMLCALFTASSSGAHAQDLYVSSDRTVANGNPINGTFNTVRVGKDSALNNYDGIHADIIGGTYNAAFFAYNTSTVNVSGGLFKNGLLPQNATVLNFGGTAQSDNFLAVFNTATLNVSGGTINALQNTNAALVNFGGTAQANTLLTFNTSTTNVTGGTFSLNGRIQDSSNVIITGGTFNNGLDAYQNSTITVTGGTITGGLSGHNSSTVNIGGTAQIDFLQITDNSTFNISGANFPSGLNAVNNSTVNFSGGTVGSVLEADNNSIVNFGGTTQAGSLIAADSSTINVTGGVVTDLLGIGGTYNISGGQIAHNTLANIGEGLGANFSLYNILGTNLTLSNAVSGIFDDGFGDLLNGVFWKLNGTLQNGDALNTRYFDFGGSLSAPAHIVGAQVVPAVPEPGSAGSLVGIALSASLWFRARRRIRGI